MGKLRVHELAKKLNMSNQELITKLSAKGLVVRTHSSSVDEQEAMDLLSGNRSALKREDGAEQRPRTMLRRRIEPAYQEKTVVLESLPIEQTESKPDQNDISKSDKEEQVPPTVVEKNLPVKDQLPEERKKDIINVTEKIPSNVVRIINADAIKERLASEGRSFGRRGGPPQQRQPYPGGGAGQGQSQPRPPRPAKDFNRPSSPTGFSPPKIDVARGAGIEGVESQTSRRSGARPSKKKKGIVSYERNKEGLSSSKEQWTSSIRRKKPQSQIKGKATQITQAAAHKRVIEMTDVITVNDLAHRMSVKAGQVVSKLLNMGMMVTVNEAIDFESASIVASEFGFEIKNVAFEETDVIKETVDEESSLKIRAPIVTVMGHVDHGKTSLLDALRETSVVTTEAGGITQHIGAYSVKTPHGMVTFLDTPGHEAFTSMRARGAQVTDLVILVVAADDGVMPQTKEAIDHAKAAKAPVVVAINKMDLPDAKPERVIQQLSELGLVPEEWGGDTQFFKVSAAKKTGLNELVDGLAMMAEIMELKANPDRPASGCVIEAKLDKGRGPVATILPQNGTLKLGDTIVVGECMGRVRAMYDSNGQKLKEAGPSMPVQVLGLSAVPTAGDKVNVVSDDKSAKTVSLYRAQKNREQELLKNKNVSLENFLEQTKEDEAKVLRLIVKTDVYGSAEALSTALKNLSTKEVRVDVVHSGVGTITESNVNLAMASQAIIIGFNIKADGKAQALAQQEKVDVRYYSIIYEAISEVKKAMSGLLAPVYEEKYLGKAEVRMIIPVSKHGKIAGSHVIDGKIVRSAKVRLKRKNIELFVGSMSGLKRFKDDVKEVAAGYECGILLEGYSDIQEGDIIECFELKQIEAKLGQALITSETSSHGEKNGLVS